MFCFVPVLQWVASHGPFVVQISLTTIVSTCLKLLNDVQSKSHFCVMVINGFGSFLSLSAKQDFIKMVKYYVVVIILLLDNFSAVLFMVSILQENSVRKLAVH